MQGTIVSLAPKTIKDHLMFAKNKGLKFPKLMFGGFKFTLAKDKSVNAGAVYVKQQMLAGADIYVGKIIDNRYYPAPHTPMSVIDAVVVIRDNPIAAATVHGQQTGTCCCCGRALTAAESINKMIGPICAEKYGF